MSWLVLIFALSAAASPPAPLPDAASWPDSVEADGRYWTVPEQWRGQRMRISPDWIPPDLCPLPDSLCAGKGPLYLRAGTVEAFTVMAAAAREDGVILRANSAYRSAATQARLIEKRLSQGRRFEEILWGVAPPGYSEHMLGSTVDLILGAGLQREATLRWMRQNAWRWSFVETYPADPTGRFPEEPWHWRRWESSPPGKDQHVQP